MKPFWMIPVYRHARQLPQLLARLENSGLPILVVDDGNEPPLALPPEIAGVRLPENQGKGASVCAGLRWGADHGFTHMVQIDADGQHDVGDALRLLDLAKENPEAFVTGFPTYDEHAPAARVSGRRVTHFFLWLEMGLKEDGLCGCRVYPVRRSLAVARLTRERRMGFDVEFPVRWVWSGWPLLSSEVRVTYPADGFSNFRMVRDNLTFFRLHARLCFLRMFHLYRKAREEGLEK